MAKQDSKIIKLEMTPFPEQMPEVDGGIYFVVGQQGYDTRNTLTLARFVQEEEKFYEITDLDLPIFNVVAFGEPLQEVVLSQ